MATFPASVHQVRVQTAVTAGKATGGEMGRSRDTSNLKDDGVERDLVGSGASGAASGWGGVGGGGCLCGPIFRLKNA